VGVRAHPGVVGQVPTWVVGIFVDHDGIAIPEPIRGVLVVIRRNAEVPVIEPETIAAAASKAILMAAPETARESAVFPRMVDMIVRVVAAGIVADPGVIVVDVRHLRMIRLIAEGTMIVLRACVLGTALLRAPLLRTCVLWSALRSAIFSRAIVGCTIVARRSASCGRRTVSGNVAAADIASAAALLSTTLCLATSFLRKSRRAKCEKQSQRSDENLHKDLS
jgi:hypothetical protein